MDRMLDDLIRDLNLPYEGEHTNSGYVITLENDDEFSDLYNMISTDTDFKLEPSCMATENNVYYVFYNDDLELKFSGDFEKDIYRLIINRR